MSFFAELKRRNVIRMAGLYLVASWLLVQVAGTVLPMFDVPAWVSRALVIFLALGFVPALVFAWVFELTPEGLKRDAEVDPQHSVTAQTGRRMDRLIVGGLLIVIALMAVERFWTADSPSRPARESGATTAEKPAEDAPGAPERSVAVLPFVNMSADPQQVYFSDGISEELLNALVKLPGLKVAGRTSSFTYRDSRADLREIGKALGVAHIVEGSVRRQGDRVRITAQLIKAGDGFHLWSETYDREVGDIFALQDEITAAIVAALELKLGAAPAPTATATFEAYNLYLQARQRLAPRGLENLIAARTLFEQSLELDPDYAPAHAGLGRTLTLVQSYGEDAGKRALSNAEASRLAKAAANKALSLDPQNAEAWSVLGVAAMWFDWDWQTASEAMERALELAPADAEVVNFVGDFHRITMDPRAVATERRAVELDPLHAVNHDDLAAAYHSHRRFEEMLEATAAADAMGFYRHHPDALLTTMLPALLGLGRIEDARALVRRLESAQAAASSVFAAKLEVARVENDAEAVAALLPALLERARAGEFSATRMAALLIGLGQPGAAAEWIERAYAAHEYALTAPRLISVPERLPDDPALRAALAKPELEALFARRRHNLKEATGAQP